MLLMSTVFNDRERSRTELVFEVFPSSVPLGDYRIRLVHKQHSSYLHITGRPTRICFWVFP